MQTLLDFLSFKSFISPSVLIVCYYLGALGVPLAMLGTLIWARREARKQDFAPENLSLWTRWATHQNQLKVLVLFIGIFICMEIGWRMMFEFMLAYFQMRDALVHQP
jgi:hypothetical protein